MSANTKNFLPTPAFHHARHTTRRHLNVMRAVIIGLVAAACAENRTATIAGPPAAAKSAGIGRSTTADFEPGVPVAYYELSLRFS
jgi:hypothetical protein